ncbi:MAG: hypothetical protein ACN4G0_08135 [Polyangiales bacterium]
MPANPTSGAIAHYHVTISDNLGGASVRACFRGLDAPVLVPIVESAARELSGVLVDGVWESAGGGRVPLRRSGSESCVEYRTRFSRTEYRSEESDSVVVSQARWLWRPEPFPVAWDASVSFSAPEGVAVSLPWARSGDVYHPGRAAFFRETYGAFGQLERDTFAIAGVTLEIAHLGEQPSEEQVRSWLRRAAETVASVGEQFPQDRLHVVIVPVDTPGPPVLFGMVRRGGGASVLLFPALGAPTDELESDWVAVHELSHLWLPLLRGQDRWLSEGIATYLQEVLRARCGLQSSARAWQRLREGFERGRKSGTGRALRDESRDMHRTGAYQRVYWAGAAFALEVDLRLREQSDGTTTLLSALRDAHADRVDTPRPIRASLVLHALDAASSSELFRSLGSRYADSVHFPDVAFATSVEYRETRARITSLAQEACDFSVESLR